jgi:uncharacterized membrane protein
MVTLLHVVFGTVALIVAPAAMFVRKGGTWHRRWGLAFIGAMAVVLVSATFMWQAKGHLFLVPLAAISAYLLFNGRRALVRRRRAPLDVAAAAWAIAAGLAVVYLAATAATPLMHSLVPILVAIGTIAIAFAVNDLLGFAARRSTFGWLLSHFAAMIAAYISAVTAFVVINAHGVPMLLRWLVPSSMGAATIVGFTLRYVRLKASGLRIPPNPAPQLAASSAPSPGKMKPTR